MKRKTLAQLIDHTALKADTTPEQIKELCAEAREQHFATVCINPGYVPLAARELAGSEVQVCTVVGFPLGATSTASKVYETEVAIAQGAVEIDMVQAIGWLKAGQEDMVREDIAAVAAVCHAHGAHLKVILENALLTDAEKVTSCRLAQEAHADFVKTSTGFAASGATVADIALMRETVGPEMGVKAAGGIHTYAEAIALIEAGATRLGASAGIQILAGAEK